MSNELRVASRRFCSTQLAGSISDGQYGLRNSLYVVHQNGGVTNYADVDNLTSGDLGSLLLAAKNAAVSGDVIFLGTCTYDIGDNILLLPDDVSLVGSGKRATVIQSSAELTTKGPIVVPGSNTTVRDLSIVGILDATEFFTGYQACIGFSHNASVPSAPKNPVPDNVTIINVHGTADSDGFYAANSGTGLTSHIRMYNCEFYAKYDAAAIFGDAADLYEAFSCNFQAVGNSVTTRGSSGVATRTVCSATMRIFGGTIGSSNGNLVDYGIESSSPNAIIEAYNVKFDTTGDISFDVYQTAGIVKLIGCAYTPSKVSGSILTSPIESVQTPSTSHSPSDTSSSVFWVDEVSHTLNFEVKYSDGTTVKSGSVSLS